MQPWIPDCEISATSVMAAGRPARVFLGGSGEPLVLVHGGWAGASAHWSTVWNMLAMRHRVVAPDLPGVGDPSAAGLPSLGAYSEWLRDVLDAVGVEKAWLVGNSFGASVVARFACDFPERCRGLVFVNGFPMPKTPALLQRLGERSLGRRLVRSIERRVAYTPSVLERGFVDAANIPYEVRQVVHAKSPPQLDALADVLIHGGGPRRPLPVSPVLLWGEDDHLPGTTKRSARKLEASLPGARLTFVPNAGHLPQVENPRFFVRKLEQAVAP